MYNEVLKQVEMKKNFRIIITVLLALTTIALFVYYISHHTNLITKLGQTSPYTIALLIGLYLLWFMSNILILAACLSLCKIGLSASENTLLSAYSTLVNFFIPGQSGPVVRGAYLNRKHKLSVKKYIFVTLLYYGFYGLVSAILLLVCNRPWWQTLVASILVVIISFSVIQLYQKRKKVVEKSIDWKLTKLIYLLMATILQAILQLAIYFIELHSINSGIHISQAITYTGAADFALFVALTPGGIGIRESFLLFSRKLHHISSANIIAASVIDRSVFLIFLAMLFVLTIVFHAKDKFKVARN